MNRILNLVAFTFFYGQVSLAQTSTICIPYGLPATIDGNFSASEWAGANSLVINISAADSVIVYLKHDSLNLYLAYLNNLESSFRFPEIMVDPDNEKSSAWQPDDWWFHISATDCESIGIPSDYGDCSVVQPDWEGVPNMVSGPPFVDTIEIIIPFVKAGIDLSLNDTIGLALDVTNTSSIWNMWPASADIDNPSTWANAVFCVTIAELNDQMENFDYQIYPNPANQTIYFSSSASKDFVSGFKVYDFTGRHIINLNHEKISNGVYELSTAALSSGNYVIEIGVGERTFFHRLQIEQ